MPIYSQVITEVDMILAFAVVATLAIWMVLAHAPQPRARRVRVRDDEDRRRRLD